MLNLDPIRFFVALACMSPFVHADVIALDEVKVLASDTAAADQFGAAVAMQGTTTVVGTPFRDTGGLADSGAAYVLVRSGQNWNEQAILTADNPASLDEFGAAVDVTQDMIVVGAPFDLTAGGRSGAAYVFVRTGTLWTQEARLVPADPSIGDRFGTSVAVWAGRVVVGSPFDDDIGTDSGAVYVFGRTGTTWFEQEKLTTGTANDELGSAVDLLGDTIAAGARNSDAGGFVYVFEKTGTTWNEEIRLQVNEPVFPSLGSSIAMTADTILAGGPTEAPVVGVAYSTQRSGTTWTPLRRIAPINGRAGDRFGSAVAIDGDRALVGAPEHVGGRTYVLERHGMDWCPIGHFSGGGGGRMYGSGVALFGDRAAVGIRLDDDGALDAGAVSLFRPVESLPSSFPVATVTASDGVSGDNFGRSVGLSGGTAVVGALGVVVFPSGNAGALYVFTQSGTDWAERAKLLPSAPGNNTEFGRSVAIDGNTILGGAPWETNSLPGSAYVFTGSGANWTEQQKLDASDGQALDAFGGAVALQGDTAFIGAPGDDHGSAYVFERTGTVWSETAKLQASDGHPLTNARFGEDISLDGGTCVIGAKGHNVLGAAYVYVQSGTSWNEEAILFPSQSDGAFGQAVDLDGEQVAIGTQESVYVFVRSGTTWTEEARLVAPAGGGIGSLGSFVALEGDTLVVDNSEIASLFLFVRRNGTWVLEQRLDACDAPLPNMDTGSLMIDAGRIMSGAAGFGPASIGGAFIFEPGEAYPSFCDASDGALASCPCGNAGGPDTGCDLPQGTGGVRLDVLAQQFSPNNRATLLGTGFPAMSMPASVVLRSAQLDPATPVVFGDGLRCVGIPIVRMDSRIAVAGSAEYTFGNGGAGTRFYQVWFRSQPALFCSPDAFNLSNGRTLSW